MTKHRKFLGIGGVGAGIAALCCFTKILVVAMAAVGLSGLVGWWLDLILFPMLAVFLGVFLYGLYLRRRLGTTDGQPE